MTVDPIDAARRRWLITVAALGPGASSASRGQSPPSSDVAAAPAAIDQTWVDAARRCSLPVRIRWPSAQLSVPSGGLPVVLFSHGLGGTVAGGERWGRAWAEAGFVVVHLQHPGSDLAAVRAAVRGFDDRAGLQAVASPVQLLARLEDVVFALDELARRRDAAVGRWAEVRPLGVGLAGHSFGAHTTLGMAGQRYPGHPGLQEPRLAAFVALSPALPVQGDPAKAFERLTRPVLCVTGTRDDDVVGTGATPDRRIGVFGALPPGRKAMLVLEDADHMTFAGQTGAAVAILPRHRAPQTLQDTHHAIVASVTTDWWRAHLMHDTAAQARLLRPALLGPGDRWLTG